MQRVGGGSGGGTVTGRGERGMHVQHHYENINR